MGKNQKQMFDMCHLTICFRPNQTWTGRVELVGGIVGGNGFREKGGRGIRVRRVQVWLLTYNLS